MKSTMTTVPKQKKLNNQIRVFAYLIENENPTYTEIKKALGLSDKTLSQTLKNLIAKDILIKNNGIYYINPLYSKTMQKKIVKLITDIILLTEPYVREENIGNNIKMILDYILLFRE